jgi:exosortase/archaeosortase family protein
MFAEIRSNQGLRFGITFLVLFLLFYYFNLFFIGITGEGGMFYSAFLDRNLNYIRWLRLALLYICSGLLELFGYETIIYPTRLKLVGGVSVGLVYTCLAYGVMSFYAAFVIAWPKPFRDKWKMLLGGLMVINILNVLRICAVLLVYSYYSRKGGIDIDHHVIFNIIVYVIIIAMIYRWINKK